LDKFQDGIFAFTKQFFLSKLGSSTSWSEPTDLTPILVEGTLQIAAWTLCGRHLAESHGEELAKLFYILENDLSVLGLVLQFPTPAVRRRENAKNRSFEIFRQEFRERVNDMRDGKQTDDDFLSVILGSIMDDDSLHSGDEQKLSAMIDEAMYIAYGAIWGVCC
jgi:cytochrome P450